MTAVSKEAIPWPAFSIHNEKGLLTEGRLPKAVLLPIQYHD